MRRLTLQSVGILIATHMASIDTSTASLLPVRASLLAARLELPPETKEAYKLGGWMAGLSTFELTSILRVTF